MTIRATSSQGHRPEEDLQTQVEPGRPNLELQLSTLITGIRARLASHKTAGDTSELMISIPAFHLLDVYQRLASQPTIEQAKGILMGTYRLNADQAFNVLIRYSQTTNTKLRVVAEKLVAGQPTTDLNPTELLQHSRTTHD